MATTIQRLATDIANLNEVLGNGYKSVRRRYTQYGMKVRRPLSGFFGILKRAPGGGDQVKK